VQTNSDEFPFTSVSSEANSILEHCVCSCISVGGLRLLPQLKSTERETATQQHPILVPPGEMEQKETQPDERTSIERKVTLQEEKEIQPLSESKEPDEMPKPKEVTAFQEDRGQEDKGQEDKGHILKTKDEGMLCTVCVCVCVEGVPIRQPLVLYRLHPNSFVSMNEPLHINASQ